MASSSTARIGADREKLQVVSAELQDSRPDTDPRVIQTVGLELLVRNASDASAEIEGIVQTLHGEIEKTDLHNYGNSREGQLSLRLAADHPNAV